MTESRFHTLLPRLLTAAGSVLLFAILGPFTDTLSPASGRMFVIGFLALLLGFTVFMAYRHFADSTDKNALWLWGILTVVLFGGMLLRLTLMSNKTEDYLYFLQVWAGQFRDEGWQAILNNSSNYTMPYLYFIWCITRLPINDLYLYKLGSIVFDCLLVLVSLRAAAHFKLSPRRTAFVGALVFLTPTVWLNSAFWSQCDAIYTFFCLLCFVCLLENRPIRSVLMAGIAFAFKLQAIFFLPVLAIYWIARKLRFHHLLFFPIPYIAALIPALWSGRSLKSLLDIYKEQALIYSAGLNWNSPSLYGLLNVPEESAGLYSKVGIFLSFCFILFLIALAFCYHKQLTDRALLLFTLSMVMGVPWFLPSMHDRYFYLADIFVILAACMLWPRRWGLYPLQLFASYGGYHAYLFRSWMIATHNMMPHSIALLAALIIVLRETVREVSSPPLPPSETEPLPPPELPPELTPTPHHRRPRRRFRHLRRMRRRHRRRARHRQRIRQRRRIRRRIRSAAGQHRESLIFPSCRSKNVILCRNALRP